MNEFASPPIWAWIYTNSIGLRCLAGVYPGPVVPSPPVDRRPVEDIEQEEEHLDYYRYYMWLGNAVIIAPQVL